MLKKKHIAMCLLCLNVSFYKAQQNYFNVPSSEITEKGRAFYQEQLNFGNSGLQSNFTFCYGLPYNTEIGINFLNLDFRTYRRSISYEPNHNIQSGPLSPEIFINAQKVSRLSNSFSLGIGGQFGIPYALYHDFDFYAYGNLLYINEKHKLKITTGIFVGNNRYLGDNLPDKKLSEENSGVQFGLEKLIYKNYVSLVLDHASGNTSIGQSVAGAAFYLPHHFILSIGMQVQNYSFKNKYLVAELTWNPKKTT